MSVRNSSADIINVQSPVHPYYGRKAAILADLFAESVIVLAASIRVGGKEFAIIDDVIILSSADRSPERVRNEMKGRESSQTADTATANPFSGQIQRGFGLEWQEFSEILPEHAKEFQSYFDLIDLSSLRDSRVCDLGCGNGRWSHFISPHCKELILVDFSDAIFVARNNLRHAEHALFFMGDVTALPFRKNCVDFAFCLGVLHHLPSPALDAVVRLAPHASTILVYLYYALDNRPAWMRAMLSGVTGIRKMLVRIPGARLRRGISLAIAIAVYKPLIFTGHLFQLFGKGHLVPLFHWYRGMSLKRIEQDAYDRFFTAIEQRVSRAQINRQLAGAFSSVVISQNPPYWHFVCKTSESVATREVNRRVNAEARLDSM